MKSLWDMNNHCDNTLGARRPDSILVEKKEKKCFIVDIAVQADVR